MREISYLNNLELKKEKLKYSWWGEVIEKKKLLRGWKVE